MNKKENNLILEFEMFKNLKNKINKFFTADEEENSNDTQSTVETETEAEATLPTQAEETQETQGGEESSKKFSHATSLLAFRNLNALKGILDNISTMSTTKEVKDLEDKTARREENLRLGLLNKEIKSLKKEKHILTNKVKDEESEAQRLKEIFEENKRKRKAYSADKEKYDRKAEEVEVIKGKLRDLINRLTEAEEERNGLMGRNESRSEYTSRNVMHGRQANFALSEEETDANKVLENIKTALSSLMDESYMRSIRDEQGRGGVSSSSMTQSNKINLEFINTIMANKMAVKDEVVKLYDIMGGYLVKGGKYTSTMSKPKSILESANVEKQLERNKEGIAANLAKFASKVYQIEENPELYGQLGPVGRHLKDFNKSLKEMYKDFYWD